MGGSIGISAANTIIQRHVQLHRNEMVRDLSGTNGLFRRQLQMQMQHHAGPHKALLRAYSLANASFNHQAQLWAYVDDFRYLALAIAACVPVAFLLKKVAGKQAEAR